MRGKKRQHRKNMDSQRENMIHRKEINSTGEREREIKLTRLRKCRCYLCSFVLFHGPMNLLPSNLAIKSSFVSLLRRRRRKTLGTFPSPKWTKLAPFCELDVKDVSWKSGLV